MSRLVRNILSNAVGGVWAIVLGLVAIPVQIRLLGSEAYGLIGFIATMQVILVIFDLGLPATVIREIARDTSDHEFSRDLIQTCSTIYWVIALISGGLFLLTAEWIAVSWLHVETLPISMVVTTVRLLAVYIVVLWPMNIYSSTLAGLQQFEVLSGLKIMSGTLGQVGGIFVLLLTHDVSAFIVWLILNNLIFLIVHMGFCYRKVPGLSLLPRVSLTVIRKIWKFSFDLNLISTLAVVYVQTDRILISALLPLRMLGYYNAAYTMSRQVAMVQEFINTAMMPALSAKAKNEPIETLRDFYYRYAQLLVYAVTLPAFILIFFGYDILKLWTTSEVANGGAGALALLAVGFLLNASVSSSYTLSIATGHSRIPLMVNIVGLGIYLPMMVYLLTCHALEGAALGWALLNTYYLMTLMPFTQYRVFKDHAFIWLTRVLLPFVALGVMTFGVGHLLLQIPAVSAYWLIVCGLSSIIYTIIGFVILPSQIQNQVMTLPRQFLARMSA